MSTQVIEYVDLTPTWQEAATVLMAVLEEGTAEGKREARAELLRMAKLADAYVASQKA